MSGSFLGPARTDQRLYCDVERVRDARSFVTRQARVFKVQDNGSRRAFSAVLVECHAREPLFLTYGVPVPVCYGKDANDRDAALPTLIILERAVTSGLIRAKDVADYKIMHAMWNDYHETNHCLTGVSAQNALGLAKQAVTDLDHLPIQEKVSAEWCCAKERLVSSEEKNAAMGFMMDGGLSFLPLTFEHMDFDDSAACSTLGFSLRITVAETDISRWCLKERKTIAAAAGRTYSESRLWQNGILAAVMTQTPILRPVKSTSNPQKSKI